MEKTLIWNGKTAEQMGLKIISLPPIQASTERIDEQDIEGRDGTLTFRNGYTSDEKPVEADYRGNKPMEIANWLQGKGEVIFGNMPDRYYNARINNVVPLDEVIRNQLYNFPIKFKCQPFSYLLSGKNKISITSSGTIINNPGTYKSLPLISVYGSGTGSLTINGIIYTLTNIGDSITIDSEIMEVLNSKGNYLECDNFIELATGKNTITFSGGITKVEIVPRWRCI
nr:distal tail protein Dit [Clostridium neonatale]